MITVGNEKMLGGLMSPGMCHRWLGGFRPSSQQMTDVVDGSDVQRTAVRARSLTGVSVCAAQAWMVAARLRALP